MTADGFWANQDAAQKTVAEVRRLRAMVEPLRKLDKLLADTEAGLDLANEAEDEKAFAEPEAELGQAEELYELVETQSLLDEPGDDGNVFLSVNAGTGGTDACDWAHTLFELYMRWARRHANVDENAFVETWVKAFEGLHRRAAFYRYAQVTDLAQEALMNAYRMFGIQGKPEDIEAFTSLQDKVQLFADTEEALTNQQRLGVKVFIYSDVETRYLDMYVAKFRRFRADFVGTTEQAGVAKPNPRTYRWVLGRTGMEARDVLTDALSDYAGTLLFVSHDRRFINALATRIVEVTPGEREARVREFLGDFDGYEAALAREADAAARPSAPAPKPVAKPRPRDNAAKKLRAEVEALEQKIEAA